MAQDESHYDMAELLEWLEAFDCAPFIHLSEDEVFSFVRLFAIDEYPIGKGRWAGYMFALYDGSFVRVLYCKWDNDWYVTSENTFSGY